MNAETPTVYKPCTETARISLKPLGRPDPPLHTHAKLDRLGIWLSAACAVHCMVMPIVMISFPILLSWRHWSRMMDALVLGVAAVFGLGGCLLSLRHHRDATPLCLVLAGLIMNATGRFAAFYLGPFLAQTLVIGGPLLMAYALWKDRRLCQCSGHTH
jgi:hypothetical protein